MAPPLQGDQAQWIQSLIMILLLAFLIATMLQQMGEFRQPRESRRLVTVEECGGQRSERDFQPGDYVGRVVGSCSDGSPRRVVAIYAVKQQAKKGLGL